MITMIFEKTLGRKIVGSVKRVPADESFARDDPANSSGAKHPSTPRSGWWKAPLSRLRRVFIRNKAAKELKEPAQMGKILNLMRYLASVHNICFLANISNSNDVYEVAQRSA